MLRFDAMDQGFGAEVEDRRAKLAPSLTRYLPVVERKRAMASAESNRVRQVRESRGVSQIALAAAAGLSRQSVGAIEAGRALPAVDVALRSGARSSSSSARPSRPDWHRSSPPRR